MRKESLVIDIYMKKLGKIPGLIELLKKYHIDPEVYDDIIHLHHEAVMSNVYNIYDILELNIRIHGKILFLFQLTIRISDIQHDELFHHIRDFILQYENEMRKCLLEINKDIILYNKFLYWKKFTIIWFLVPFHELYPINV